MLNRLWLNRIQLSCAAWLALFTGCTLTSPDRVLGPGYRPANIHQAADQLPPHLKRVALLPISSSGTETVLERGREIFQPILRNELTKTGKFEVVPVTAQELKHWSGRAFWSSSEALPLDFFHRLRNETGADAVLFSELTRFNPYEPLVIGWRMKLVSVNEPVIWWAADEIFNAGQPVVINAARRYYQRQQMDRPPLANSWSILRSPREFGHYTAHAVFETLPGR